jgi:hypothetical protein
MVRVTEKTASLEPIATPAIEKRILVVRGRRVMADEDLADLYGVETKRLIEQVKRNVERFPADFMFQLDETEAAALRSQIATSKAGRGGRRYALYVFTEQGVAMLSGVLRSKRDHRQYRDHAGVRRVAPCRGFLLRTRGAAQRA